MDPESDPLDHSNETGQKGWGHALVPAGSGTAPSPHGLELPPLPPPLELPSPPPPLQSPLQLPRIESPWGEDSAAEDPGPISLEVRHLREQMGLTQRQFAGWFGFPLATLRHWECGDRRPAGCALVLLQVIREHPQVVLQAVRKARRWRPGSVAAIAPLRSHRAPPGFGDRPLPRRRR